DPQNRLLTHTHQVDANPVEYLTRNKYNEISQLENKKVGGVAAGTPLQQIDYKYNIRGWMTQINDPDNLSSDLFGYKIRYQNPVNTAYAPGRHNGNISEVDWKTSNDGVLRRYSYSYDALNRLNYGHYSEPNGTVPQEDHFGETAEYDLNGNITRLYRNAKNTTNGLAMQIDNLSYTYTGNRLLKVTDASQNYLGYTGGGNTIEYDLNGNMTKHLDKGISEIKYNFLNLPNYINISQGKKLILKTQLQYIYRADGVKVSKKYSPIMGNIETNYLEGFQYDNSETGLTGQPLTPTLKFVPTAEGYFDYVKNKYIYNYTDHLGNIRLSYFNNGSSIEALEENNYYPFGLKHEGVNVLTGNPAYQYKYNGKELQETGMVAMDWRHYMPDIGRFGVMDPLAGVIPSWTPYRFAFNNPVYFKDPTGLFERGPEMISDWIKIPGTDNYKYDPSVTGPDNTPKDWEYVGPTGTYTNSNGDLVRLLANGEKEIQIQEVAVTGKKSDSGTLDYLNFFNDRIGDTGDLISHRPNQGGSIGFWTSTLSNRRFDGINYNRLNVRYYSNNWTGGGRARVRTINASKFLKKGSIVGQVVLGAVEIGQGVADDVNDYNTKGETNGKNTAVASAKVATGAAIGWAAGAATGALIGSSFPVVGTIVGAVVGGVAGYYASEAAGELVEKAYE
ncbi:RHS repeat-associated core domain-containing protein, partial [Chryseobacterium sp. NRRL B-14859]|uniref:RHS repeat domain-containing protein n=1 Tax=Chryseobacterium sp. NRRL B-14859 TaxID=1562763 RepID=UPI00339B3071